MNNSGAMGPPTTFIPSLTGSIKFDHYYSHLNWQVNSHHVISPYISQVGLKYDISSIPYSSFA